MTKFNPENKELLTYDETLKPAMYITDKANAQQYFKDYVSHIQGVLDKNPREDGRIAESIAKENLGYYAGYYSHEVRARVEELFECSHPVFGSIKENGIPTPEEVFETGYKIGRKMRQHD